jgi:hypothetical protein
LPFRNRILLLASALAGLAIAAPAQQFQFGVGGSYGWYNDVERQWSLSAFHSPNWEAWLEAGLGEDVLLRGTYGTMRVQGDNVGQLVDIDGEMLPMPDYRDRIGYFTADVTYLFWEGPFTSGIFGGVGGYSIRPEEISPEFDPFRDNREIAFGLNAGVDGTLHVYRGFSLVGRAAFHGIFSQTNRSLLICSLGAVYRF